MKRWFRFPLLALTLAGSGWWLIRHKTASNASYDIEVVEGDPEKTWSNYWQTLRRRRLAEVGILYSRMTAAGVTERTQLILSFSSFASSRRALEELSRSLEGYEIRIERFDSEYWTLHGSTRPRSVRIDKQRLTKWVEYVFDKGANLGCVLSEFQASTHDGASRWDNNDIEL